MATHHSAEVNDGEFEAVVTRAVARCEEGLLLLLPIRCVPVAPLRSSKHQQSSNLRPHEADDAQGQTVSVHSASDVGGRLSVPMALRRRFFRDFSSTHDYHHNMIRRGEVPGVLTSVAGLGGSDLFDKHCIK
jgi:hypothetical protein